jgi:hypothetical protein
LCEHALLLDGEPGLDDERSVVFDERVDLLRGEPASVVGVRGDAPVERIRVRQRVEPAGCEGDDVAVQVRSLFERECRST